MYFQFFSSVLGSIRLNTTKYGIKKAKIPLKRPQNARKTLSTLPNPHPSLSKHMGDGKEKLGRGPYAISTAILSMYAGF